MSICAQCGEEKKHHAKGLCKPCYMRRWCQANPEKVAASCARYREGHREELTAYLRLWEKENPASGKGRCRRWREANRDYIRRYAQENPEKRVAAQARREARKRNLPDTLTIGQAEHLLAVGQAMYPEEKLELDHIVPLSRGGGTTLANMHAIPASLNNAKQDMLPQELYEQAGLFRAERKI